MKLTFDPAANIAYLRVREPTTGVESIRVSDELIVDIGPDGRLYGLELLNANEQIASADGGRLLVESVSGIVTALDVAAE